jgi:hypothetical protein
MEKSVDWLRKENTIKNPYYGSQMLPCGKTVETTKKFCANNTSYINNTVTISALNNCIIT